MKFLLGELTGKRPLMPQTLQTSAEQADVLNTFRTIAQLPGDSLGAYVISMARSASDVLAVVLLQVCIPPFSQRSPLGPHSLDPPRAHSLWLQPPFPTNCPQKPHLRPASQLPACLPACAPALLCCSPLCTSL